MKYSDKLLELVLGSIESPDQELVLRFRLFDTPTARRWAELVAFLFHYGGAIRTYDRFYNFDDDPKADARWIRGEIEECIEGINQIYPGFIESDIPDYLSQEVMNQLHEYFVDGALNLGISKPFECAHEGMLVGEFMAYVQDHRRWDRFVFRFTRYTLKDPRKLDLMMCVQALNDCPESGAIMKDFYLSFDPARPFLERLNEAIHRWEDRCAFTRAIDRGGEGWRYFVVNFDPTCWVSIDASDFKHFTTKSVFGRVYLDDIFPGKCIWDVYNDDDEIIAEEHYKNLHYFWGDCSFYMGPSHSNEMVSKKMAAFWEWYEARRESLERIGFSREDPKMAIGRFPVADLECSGRISGLERHEVNQLISKHQKFKSLNIVMENGKEAFPKDTIEDRWEDFFLKNIENAGKIFV